jgi:hypothetical protein
MRVISFTVSANGETVTGPDSLNVSVADTGTGVKTITLNEAFADANYQVLVTTATADTVAQRAITSSSVCVVNTFDSTDGTTAKDAICDILIIGSDVTDKFKG